MERHLHHKFQKKRVQGEWFRLEQEDIEYIKGLEKSLENYTYQEQLFVS